MSVPERVKKIRETLGKTQKDMAAAIPISYRTWQNYEDGVNSPNWDVCEALVKLGFNANWLLTGEGEMKRPGAVYPLGEGLKNGDTTGERPAAFDQHIKRADRSPIKQAAVSYIDAMADTQVAEVIKFLVPKEKPWMSADDIALQNMSPEGKARVRAAIEAQIKEIEDATASDPIELRPTGT